jgi:hypothetical protein
MNQKLVSTRQFKKRDGTWVKEVTVDAEDKTNGMTAGELMEVLATCPPNMYPKFVVRIPGQVKQVKFRVEMVEE